MKGYIKEGKDLAKGIIGIIDTFSEILLKSDIQPPAVAWGPYTIYKSTIFGKNNDVFNGLALLLWLNE